MNIRVEAYSKLLALNEQRVKPTEEQLVRLLFDPKNGVSPPVWRSHIRDLVAEGTLLKLPSGQLIYCSDE